MRTALHAPPAIARSSPASTSSASYAGNPRRPTVRRPRQAVTAPLGTISPLGRTRLTNPSDVRQTNALVVAWKTDTRSIMLDCDRAQTRLVPMERRAR